MLNVQYEHLCFLQDTEEFLRVKCFSDMHQGKKIKSISVSLQRAARGLMDALAQIAFLLQRLPCVLLCQQKALEVE